MDDRRQRWSPRAGVRSLLALGALWLAGSLFLAAIVGQDRVLHDQLLLDTAAYAELAWYSGLVSNVGVLGWAVATATATWGAWLCRVAGREGPARLLGGGALLSALLTLDDLFQLHVVVPAQLGVSKTGSYLLYLLLAIVWAGANAAEIERAPFPLLGAAAVSFASSLAADQVGDGAGRWLVAEDALKFLGILAWALFFSETTAAIARSLVTAPVDDQEAGEGGDTVSAVRRSWRPLPTRDRL